MKFESRYLSESFSRKFNPGYIKSALVGPFITIMIWAIFVPQNDARRVFGKVIEGIKMMSANDFLIAGLIGIPVSILLVLIAPMLHDSKKIIVFFEFNDDSKMLLIKTRRITKDIVEESKIPYSKLKQIEIEKVYDGMATQAYKGIELNSNYGYEGFILKNHFTWSDDDFSSICFES
jgi:hypothetical protein